MRYVVGSRNTRRDGLLDAEPEDAQSSGSTAPASPGARRTPRAAGARSPPPWPRPGRRRPERARGCRLARAAFQRVQGGAPRPLRAAARAARADALHLRPLQLGVDAQDVGGRLRALLLEAVHAHDDALARLHLALEAVGRLLDLPLDLAPLDRARAPPRRPRCARRARGLALQEVGGRFHRVRPAERIHGVRHAGLERDDLLRAQGQARRVLRGQGQRLVLAVGVQALAAAQHGGQRLQGDPDDVVVRLLRGEGHPARLDVEAEVLRLRVVDAEPLLHEARPQPARGAELRHLLDEVGMAGEEEREPLAEAVPDRVRPRARRARTRARART